MSRLVLTGVSKAFHTIVAVDSVSLSLDGELLTILGPSGCGKTTLLRLIAGLETPTSGQIRIGNQIVNGVAARHRRVATVFQEPTLYPHLSVRANLAFAARLRGVSSSVIQQNVEQAAKDLQIATLLERMPRQLSGGERQRVALGRAIVARPSVLLLDEPLASVDVGLRMRLQQLIRQVQRQLGVPTIYVTHDQEEALATGDRVAVMQEGRIHQISTPRTLYESPSNLRVACLVGNPPMNLLVGQVVADGSTWSFVTSGVSVQLERNPFGHGFEGSRPSVLGIRPERLSVGKCDDSHRPDCVLEGRVREVRFTGPSYLATVELGEGLVWFVRTSRCDLTVGQICTLSFAQQDATFFDQ
jgi:multiple sugar transport system ATP-binding protein